jgi:hypothetical protein
MKREDAREANELIAHALDTARRPRASERYRHLLRRYQTEPSFTETVNALAEPLGLRVLAADELHGLILDATEGSPFAPTLEGLRRSLRIPSTVEDRLIYGLIIAGISAWCYPSADSFTEPGLRHVRAAQVERKLRELCDRLAQGGGAAGDEPELRRAFAAYAARKPYKQGKGGALTHDCTLWMVGHTLRWLADQQFLLRDPKDAELYRATDRFRHHVSAAASRRAYDLIAAAMARAAEAPAEEAG